MYDTNALKVQGWDASRRRIGGQAQTKVGCRADHREGLSSKSSGAQLRAKRIVTTNDETLAQADWQLPEPKMRRGGRCRYWANSCCRDKHRK